MYLLRLVPQVGWSQTFAAGRVQLTAGSTSITLSIAGTSGYVIADAVRWVKA